MPCHSGARRAIGSNDVLKVILSSLVWILSSLFLVACDFHGPWEYYPEERDVYTGIYTYGYILDNGKAEVCFSKVYELEESSAQAFAFYDSAYVTVQGVFDDAMYHDIDTTLVLEREGNPNCFRSSFYNGISGNSYTLNAFFVWDSAGQKVQSSFKATATIPSHVEIKGMNVPQQDGSYKWNSNPRYNENIKSTSRGNNRDFYVNFTVGFLEYPMDLEFMKVALAYDNSVRGVLSIMNYSVKNDESQKTTVNNMFTTKDDEDSYGYRGIALHDPLEEQQNLGFMSNRAIAGTNSLDTLYLMNINLPIGKLSVDLYATDGAYIDYMEKVKQSVVDSRFIPESNIENGMGVFSGMAKTTISINVDGDGVPFTHIAWRNCGDTKGDFSDSWDSRECRLYQDIACSGNAADLISESSAWSDKSLIIANERAVEGYRDTVYNRDVKSCFASNVKAAMILDTTRWSLFLPDTISAEDKMVAYADGLKRYCVAKNFENNSIADCSALKKECLEGAEKTNCKVYLWTWCADRDWNMRDYPQCKSAFVSRYYIEGLKSNILKREVENICRESEYRVGENRKDEKKSATLTWDISACKLWCKDVDGKTECQ